MFKLDYNRINLTQNFRHDRHVTTVTPYLAEKYLKDNMKIFIEYLVLHTRPIGMF